MKEISAPFKISRPVVIIIIGTAVAIFGFIFIRNLGNFVTGKVSEGMKGMENLKLSEMPQTPGFQKVAIEQEMEKRVQSIFDKVLGPEKAIVRVSVELSPQIQNKEEVNTPKEYSSKDEIKATMSSGDIERSGDGAGNEKPVLAEGTKLPNDIDNVSAQEQYFIFPGYPPIDEVAKVLPVKGALATGTKATRETLSSNYTLDKKFTETTTPAGTMGKITIFALIDYDWRKAFISGKSKPYPRSEKDMQTYRTLVENAIGYDAARGDQIEIRNVPFRGARPIEEMKERLVLYVTILLLMPILYFIVKATLNFLQRRAEEKKAEIQFNLKEEEELKQKKLKEDQEYREKIQLHQEQVFQIGKGHPDICARIIRNWLT